MCNYFVQVYENYFDIDLSIYFTFSFADDFVWHHADYLISTCVIVGMYIIVELSPPNTIKLKCISFIISNCKCAYFYYLRVP